MRWDDDVLDKVRGHPPLGIRLQFLYTPLNLLLFRACGWAWFCVLLPTGSPFDHRSLGNWTHVLPTPTLNSLRIPNNGNDSPIVNCPLLSLALLLHQESKDWLLAYRDREKEACALWHSGDEGEEWRALEDYKSTLFHYCDNWLTFIRLGRSQRTLHQIFNNTKMKIYVWVSFYSLPHTIQFSSSSDLQFSSTQMMLLSKNSHEFWNYPNSCTFLLF